MDKAVAAATAVAAEEAAAWVAAAAVPAAPCAWLRQHLRYSVRIVLRSLVPVAVALLAALAVDLVQSDELVFAPTIYPERPAQRSYASLISRLARA